MHRLRPVVPDERVEDLEADGISFHLFNSDRPPIEVGDALIAGGQVFTVDGFAEGAASDGSLYVVSTTGEYYRAEDLVEALGGKT